jgi:hypothetical protein
MVFHILVTPNNALYLRNSQYLPHPNLVSILRKKMYFLLIYFVLFWGSYSLILSNVLINI